MPDPYHVVYLLHSLGRGGTENGVVNLLNRMDLERFRFSLVLIQRERALLERVERDGVEVHSVGRRWGNDPLFPLKLMTLLRKLKPDLVHTRGFACIEGLPAARMAGVPATVHSEHGREVEELVKMKGRRAALRAMLYPMADVVATVCGELAEWIGKHVKSASGRLAVLPNGVDTDRFRNLPAQRTARRKLGLPLDARIIGSVGRHDPVKDYGCLLRAFVRVYDAHSDAHLVLVGDGPQNSALRSAAWDLQIHDRVHFVGWSDDLPLALTTFDVFVLPSLSEGMSNALLEAMAAGLPCVATDVGGNRDVIEDGVSGVLVPSRSPERLAEALEGLIESETLRNLFGAAAQARARALFSLDAMVARYEDLYLGLIEKGRKGAQEDRGAARAPGALQTDLATRQVTSG